MMAKEAGVSDTSDNPTSVGNNNKALNIGILNNLENDLSDVGLSEVSETTKEERKKKTSSCGYTFSDKINIEDMDFISRKYMSCITTTLPNAMLCCLEHTTLSAV